MSANVMEISESAFATEVGQATGTALVDFWAPWCGPCLRLGPVVEEIATEYAGKLKVVKINIDDNPQITARYGIQSIPTLMVFRDGEAVERIIGAVAKDKIREAVNKHV